MKRSDIDSNALFGVVILQPKDRKPRKTRRKRIKEKFKKRQQARQWCRNHWHKYNHKGMGITQPNRPNEPFRWNGVL
jgi:hypothetical protein